MKEKEALQGCPPGQVPSVFHQLIKPGRRISSGEPYTDSESVSQPCPTLGDPMDCSPPGSSVHGILQARILEWVAMPSSSRSSQPRDQTCIARAPILGQVPLWAC